MKILNKLSINIKKQSNSYALKIKYCKCVLDNRLFEIILLYIFCHCQNSGSLKIKTAIRKQPGFCYTTTGFPIWGTSEEILYWWCLTTQLWVFLWLIIPRWKFASTSQKHYPGVPAVGWCHVVSMGISACTPQL